MFDIIELQHELSELEAERKEANRSTADNEESNYSRFKARIASRTKDIDTLWRQNTSVDNIAAILMVHPNIVKARIARLEEDEEGRREFLQLGIMSDSLQTGGYAGIFQK
jgi:hypothetical protein